MSVLNYLGAPATRKIYHVNVSVSLEQLQITLSECLSVT